ncbi:hypothetical protein V2J09_009908 [Rumex salicifolius]
MAKRVFESDQWVERFSYDVHFEAKPSAVQIEILAGFTEPTKVRSVEESHPQSNLRNEAVALDEIKNILIVFTGEFKSR